jgi:aspartate/tyrosine/aromatic aminotransferase
MFDTNINEAPKDPILSLIEEYQTCENSNKIDLTIGIYNDDSGHCTLLNSVKEAEALYLTRENTKAYQGIAGDKGFCQSISNLFYDNLFSKAGK